MTTLTILTYLYALSYVNRVTLSREENALYCNLWSFSMSMIEANPDLKWTLVGWLIHQ